MSAIGASSRQKACDGCSKAKRRCDLLTPICSRCCSKSLECVYKNVPLNMSAVPSEGEGTENDASLVPFAGEDVQIDTSFPDIDFAFLLEFVDTAQLQISPPSHFNSPVSIADQVSRWSGIHSRDSIAWVINNLKTYPSTFVLHGNTPFIHSLLYRNELPKVVQETFSICATYKAMTEFNKSIILRIIGAKVDAIVQDDIYSWSWSLVDNLSYVQSLILTQIIQLFDGDIRQRALGEKNESFLVKWTDQLQWHLHTGLNDTYQCSLQYWVIAESARRTILISYILRGYYSFCKHDKCDPSHYVLAVALRKQKFTPQARLWDSPLENLAMQATAEACTSQKLISYAELDELWDARRSTQFQAFERFLLVACKGEGCSEIIASA